MKIDRPSIKRVLVAKLRHHGDVLLSSPVFSALKKALPHAEIDAYIYQETHPMLHGHPDISDFIFYDKGWKKMNKLRRIPKEIALLRKIRRRRYDLVVNLTEGDRGAIAARASRARYAVGFDPEGSGMVGKTKCYTHLVKHTHLPRHSVEKDLDALRVLGIFPEEDERELTFVIPEDDRDQIEMQLKEAQVEIGQYVLIHPVSRWMFKSYPPQKMAELIDSLHRKGHQIVMTSSPDDGEMKSIDEICRHIPKVPILNLAGKTSLKELGALISMAKLLITVDSVPLHLASALKTPVVALFGPTSELKWGPWRNPHSRVVTQNMSCRPCYRPGCGGSGRSDCLDTLPVQNILRAAEELLETQIVKSSPK